MRIYLDNITGSWSKSNSWLQQDAMSWGCLGPVFCVILYILHSLESFGLRRDHNWSCPHAGQVPRTQFRGRAGFGVGGRRGGWCRTGFRSLGSCLNVARWRPRQGGGLAVYFVGSHSWNTGSLAPKPHVMHHGLGGRGAWARAAGAGWGEGVGLHQLGFGSLCILPEMSIWLCDSKECSQQIQWTFTS